MVRMETKQNGLTESPDNQFCKTDNYKKADIVISAFL